MRRNLAALLILGALALAACGDDDDDDAAPDSVPAEAGESAADCAAGNTIESDVLTIATGDPAFPPYVIDDAPETGEGFEAAVALGRIGPARPGSSSASAES